MATWHCVNAAVTADTTILQYPTEFNLFTALSKKLCFDHYLVKSINKSQNRKGAYRNFFEARHILENTFKNGIL